MSQMFLATRGSRQAIRTWAGFFSGSLVLAGAMSGYTQEIHPPRELTRTSSSANHVPLGSLTLDGHSCLELESDSLPAFPIDERIESVTSEGYRPAALQRSRSGFIPTGLPRAATPQEPLPVVVTALPNIITVQPHRTVQETAQPTTLEPTPLELNTIGQETQGWTLRPVAELDLFMYSGDDLPKNTAGATLNAAENGTQPSIANVGTVAAWVAPNLTYQPLLFEDARLERYGYASPYYGVQPIRSGVHFASSSILFPWRVWFHRNECESPLAFERPGSYAPTTRETFVPAITSGWVRP